MGFADAKSKHLRLAVEKHIIEEYSDGDGSKTRFFFEGDKLAGIRNIGEEYGSC